MNDGGSRIQFYRIEFRKKESARWIFQGNAENQFSDDEIQEPTLTIELEQLQ